MPRSPSPFFFLSVLVTVTKKFRNVFFLVEAFTILIAATMSDEEHHFESSDAGASKTYPQQAGTIRKNGYIIIKGVPARLLRFQHQRLGSMVMLNVILLLLTSSQARSLKILFLLPTIVMFLT